jgi:outer membrane murein-binding lipoprotein Lpp
MVRKQKKEIEKLQAKTQKVEKLEQQVEKLSNQLEQLKGDEEAANRFKNNSSEDLNERTVAIGNEDTEKQPMLLQNRPNPYSNETVIPYYLPKDFKEASMLITDINGQLIKRVSLQKSGKGELTLRTGSLGAGKYIYTLVVDGKQVESRKMVVKSNR